MRQGITVGVTVLALAVSATAGAQPVDSFEDLEGLLERGADVAATYGWQHVVGRALDLSPTSMTLVIEAHPLEHEAVRLDIRSFRGLVRVPHEI